jgi:hypothetical protein
MLLLTTAVFSVGALQKTACANRPWVERNEGLSVPCYTDIPLLLRWEQLTGSRLPYVDRCEPADRPCDEYPVLSMYLMKGIASSVTGQDDPYRSFYLAAAVLLLICALAIAWVLEALGARTILFIAAPVLLLTGATNLDLVPVAFSVSATLLFLRRRDASSGILLGIGAAMKVYPGVLVVPFAASRLREGRRDRALVLAGCATGAYVLANLPFALFARDGWLTFFRFNAHRGGDYDTLWFLACRVGMCPPTGLINVASVVLAGLGTAWAWRLATHRRPDLPRWMMSFPLLAMILLTSKVWSSQYSLWLLPWFAFSRVPLLPFAEYQASEVFEYLVRYEFFIRLGSDHPLPYAVLAFAVAVRALLLLRCIVAWTRDPEPAPGVGAAISSNARSRPASPTLAAAHHSS